MLRGMKPMPYRILGLAMVAGGLLMGALLMYRMTGGSDAGARGPFMALVVCAVAALTGLGLLWRGEPGEPGERAARASQQAAAPPRAHSALRHADAAWQADASQAEASSRREVSPHEQASAREDALLDQIRTLAVEGRKMEAIQRYRELTGAGLAESKDVIESMERQAA